MLNPLTLALLATVAGVANAGCNRDNCLRAIIASAFPTRSGSADCASYFRTTVTPATITHYATLTLTESTTTSGTALEVTTTTEIEPFTVVVATTVTTVETDIVTLAINVKRQQTEAPCEIPTYASACSGAVRYSSACSCVGATRSTVMAAAPTTTVTVTVIAHETFTYSTTTTSTEVETDRITITVPTTTTATTTTATTTTAIHTRPAFQVCTGPYNVLNVGGCGPGCYCDQSVLSLGFCNAAGSCGQACSTDLDCPDYSACSSNHPECNGGGVCLDFSLCLSVDVNLPTLPINVPKRLAMRGDSKNKRNGILIRPTN